MDKTKIAAALRENGGNVEATARALGANARRLKEIIDDDPPLVEVREHYRTVAALTEAAGNVNVAASALGMSRQGLHHRIKKSDALHASFVEIQKANEPAHGSVEGALRTVVVDVAAIEMLRVEKNLTARVATRAWLVAKLCELTSRSERDVSAQVKAPPCRAMFEAILPKPTLPNPRVDHVIFPVSLTPEQGEWLRAQKRGTAGALLRSMDPMPVRPVGPEPLLPVQTSYSLPAREHERLVQAAREQDIAPGMLFRYIVDLARPSRAQGDQAA